MSPEILKLIGVGDWPAFVLVSARVAGFFLAAPLWSTVGLPKSIRSAAAVLLSVILIPTVIPVAPIPDDMVAAAVMLGGETLMGVAIALTGAMFMHGVMVAGEVASLQMGLSLGQAIGSLPEGATVGVGQLKGYFASLIYLSLGGHLTLYQALAASFAAVPPGKAMLGVEGGRLVADLAGSVFSSGIRAAAPVMVALLLANLALAILGKAVPQLNVMMLAFPVTISIGMIALGASLPFLAAFVGGQIDALPDLLGRTIGAFHPAGQ
ncbi:MAG TPA: flagellar biosynthetic protein FliR [Gemmatimonadales bacterium]|nr:flagellar biosynthetic protein FliR [Gemmatimonadales bacterium]